MASKFTRCDLKAIIRQGVEQMEETELFCERLNGFLVLNHKSDLNADVPDKEPEDWFYRSETVRYPILTLYESEPDETFFGKCKGEKVRFEIGILDQLLEGCKSCNACENRKEEELYKNAHRLLKWWACYMETITGYSNGVDCIWQSNILPVPAGYTEDRGLTRRFQTPFRQDNKTSKGNRWRNISDNLYGVFRIFFFTFWDCSKPEIKLTEKVMANKDCC